MTLSEEKAGPHILLVEDHRKLREMLARTLELSGYRITTAETGDLALTLLNDGLAIDILLSDVRMPGATDGIQLAHWVRVHRPSVRILLQTAYSSAAPNEFRVLLKPFTPDELLTALATLAADIPDTPA